MLFFLIEYFGLTCLNTYMLQTANNTKDIEQPDYKSNHNNDIKKVFDCALHWNVVIHQPEYYPGNNQNDDNS
jgi:hypothetical protein